MITSSTEYPTVLVVDDESELADLYAVWLQDSYNSLTAYSGLEALETIDERVDVVLLDRRMPDMSGDKVLKNLRDRGFEQPVAMATAVEPGLDVVDLYIDEYMIKPLDRETIGRVVDTLVTRNMYDRKTRVCAALATKKSLLQSHVGMSELEPSEKYAELTERLATMRTDTNVSVETLLRNKRSASVTQVR